MSVRILIRFNCLLRTGELLQLGVADIMINDQLTFATINLPDTREKRTGIIDSTTHRCSTLPPPGTDSITKDLKLFAEAFNNWVTTFSQQLASEALGSRRCHKPLPSRISLDNVLRKGRWANQRTAQAGHCNPQHHFRSRRQNEPSL